MCDSAGVMLRKKGITWVNRSLIWFCVVDWITRLTADVLSLEYPYLVAHNSEFNRLLILADVEAS